MNRAIKFRAWDSMSQRMYYQGEPDLENIQSFFHHYNDNDKLMQFTGLTNKNGGEVYEGDILDTFDGYGIIVRSSYDGGWDVRFSDGCVIGIFEIIKSLVVAGNIYENPELLKNETT